MTEVVLDASIIARWFGPTADPPSAKWRSDFEAGRLDITLPALIFLELVNVAARQWRWTDVRLLELVRQLETSRFDIVDPHLDRVASWAARGLTAYDATYVALAEERGTWLITHDREILRVAKGIAQPVDVR
ncbi:MAG: type II toxin-antitoxin system VapC family toxin [Candidatus Limnocylindria bacterium]